KHGIAREDRRPAPIEPVLRAEALQIAPHVAAADRVHVERRVLDAELRREDGPEEERLPLESEAGSGAFLLDSHRGDVRVRARRLEPELHRFHRYSVPATLRAGNRRASLDAV